MLMHIPPEINKGSPFKKKAVAISNVHHGFPSGSVGTLVCIQFPRSCQLPNEPHKQFCHDVKLLGGDDIYDMTEF